MSTSRINPFKIQSKNFKIIKEINKGTFGIIYEVEEKKTAEHYAAKIIITGSSRQDSEMVNREVQILMRIQNPTLLGFRGFSTTDFSGNKNITIFMDLVENGTLEEVLDKVQKSLAYDNYNNTTRQIILVGIAYGMMILHHNYIIHRNLKPGNILIDKLFYPHIADFGLSKFIDSDHSKSQSKSFGAPIYMAPEVIEGKRYDGKADVFSFGIIMFQIITDTRPYPLFDKGKLTEFKFHKKVVDENYRPTFTVPVKKALKKLIERCWAKDPKIRPTFEEIFNRLAYNREFSIYNVFNEENNEEEEEENEGDETPYYLNDVDVDELFLYLDIITEKTNNKSSDNSSKELINKLIIAINKQQKLNEKMQKDNSDNFNFISQQKERIDIQEKQIFQQKDIIERQEKPILELKKIIFHIFHPIATNILYDFNKYFI